MGSCRQVERRRSAGVPILKKFEEHSSTKGYVMIDQWTPIDVREFRTSWGVSHATASKNMSSVKAFFEFALRHQGRLGNLLPACCGTSRRLFKAGRPNRRINNGCLSPIEPSYSLQECTCRERQPSPQAHEGQRRVLRRFRLRMRFFAYLSAS